jgi:predicted nucleic acid-binding protein
VIRLLAKKIVIDACVAIDLNIPKVDFLEEFLNCSNDDQLLISSANYGEIHYGVIIASVIKNG